MTILIRIMAAAIGAVAGTLAAGLPADDMQTITALAVAYAVARTCLFVGTKGAGHD